MKFTIWVASATLSNKIKLNMANMKLVIYINSVLS